MYCQDNNRRGAITQPALKRISTQVRRWRLHRKIFHTFGDLARLINPPATTESGGGSARVPTSSQVRQVMAHGHRRAPAGRRRIGSRREARHSPACQPGARPWAGGRIVVMSWPDLASNQEVSEFEFHISPAPS